jgi:hypothetical protein
MAELTIEQQLRLLARHIDRIGNIMVGVDEIHTKHGHELIGAGGMVQEWASEIKGAKDELEASSDTTCEAVRAETADQVEESE